jgi:hypothetical protein
MHPDVDPCLSRTLDSRRAKNEDLKIIKEWFQPVDDNNILSKKEYTALSMMPHNTSWHSNIISMDVRNTYLVVGA